MLSTGNRSYELVEQYPYPCYLTIFYLTNGVFCVILMVQLVIDQNAMICIFMKN